MFFDKESLEKKIERLDKHARELEEENAALDKSAAQLFRDLEVSPEQVRILLSDRSQFSDAEWQHIEDLRRSQDERLACTLGTVRDPRQAARKYASRNVNPNWLFVK